MVRRTPTGTSTFAEFLELIQEDQKADLLDGVIYLASPENSEHNKLLRWLTFLLGGFIEGRNLGELTINKMAYRLTDRTAPEPDLGFVAAPRVDCIKFGYVEGPPDLAVEIVSPDSADRDYENKRQRYEEAGVLEYWIIDPLESTATVLVRQGDRFLEQIPQDHVYRSTVLPGFSFDARWLWERPLPPTMQVVTTAQEQWHTPACGRGNSE